MSDQDGNRTPPRKRHVMPYTDRMLPNATPSAAFAFSPATTHKRKYNADSVSSSSASNPYQCALRSELLNQHDNPSVSRSPVKSPPTKKLLAYKSPTHNRRLLDDWGNFGRSSSLTPVRLFSDSPMPTSHASQFDILPLQPHTKHILATIDANPQKISKTPYKVLDAPDLEDDFYLNLVDWGRQNILSVGLKNCVYLWNSSNLEVTKLCDLGSQDSVTSVNWDQKGSLLAVGTDRGLVQLWDVQKGRKVRVFAGHHERVGTISWCNNIISSGSRDKLIFNHDIRQPQDFQTTYTGHTQEICGLKWNPNNHMLASGGNDNHLFVWESRQNRPLYKFAEHTAAIKALAWNPASNHSLVSGGGTADRTIRFWSTNMGNGNLQKTHLTDSQVCNLAYSSNGDSLVSTHGYSQNQIHVWKTHNMESMATLTGHTYRVLYLSTSPDGQSIVTGAGDETLRFWNVFNKKKKHIEDRGMTFHQIR